MDPYPASLISALSEDLQREVGLSYESLKAYPAIPPDSDHRLASAISLAQSIVKKFLPIDHSEQDKACLSKFLSVNKAAGAWSLRLNTSGDEELWGTFKSVLYDFFTPGGFPLVSNLDQPFLLGRVGPGSAIGARNGDFYTKLFASDLTCSSQGLVVHYLTNIRRFSEWSIAETIRSLDCSEPRIVKSSSLSFVPKNVTISRSICTEPSLNMFYQLGVGHILVKRLKTYFNIDVETQPQMNGLLACAGSKDNLWSTIDLESASDSVSLGLVKEVIPEPILGILLLLRSKHLKYQGNMHELHMVSTMGNGFTFPLQTAIFAAMVKASMISVGQTDRVSVFGDDIVAPSYCVRRLKRLLELSGFTINEAKSFTEGPFRESCGFDYFLGRNIRGVYIKRLQTLQDSYAAINALNGFSARTGIVLSSVMNYLLSKVDRSIEIPLWEDPSSGIRLPIGQIASRRVSRRTFGTIYSKYCFKPRRLQIKVGGMRLKGRFIPYNCAGLLLAALSGMALSSGLPLRDEGRWKKERRSCSYWDSFEAATGFYAGTTLQRLENAIYFNLYG
jgi:hypothetical protein